MLSSLELAGANRCATADEAERCQQSFCRCDQAAIECLSHASYDSALRGLAASSCLATHLSDGGSGEACSDSLEP